MQEDGFSKELYYSETTHLPNLTTSGTTPTSCVELHCEDDDHRNEGDGLLWGDGSGEELFDELSDLDWEWQKRRNQFHTIGYRDGLIAGKEAAAQEGFNIGFKESVLVGYRWGLVRGITSAFGCLPDGLKERLIETEERRSKFRAMGESVHSVSTTDALKLFDEDVMRKKEVEQSEQVDTTNPTVSDLGLQKASSSCSRLENYVGELQLLLNESPAIESRLSVK